MLEYMTPLVLGIMLGVLLDRSGLYEEYRWLVNNIMNIIVYILIFLIGVRSSTFIIGGTLPKILAMSLPFTLTSIVSSVAIAILATRDGGVDDW